jgi:hypothetical protein
LEETFGPDALPRMNRLTADGPVASDLDTELSEMEILFYGAYAVVCGELGLEPELGPLGRDPRADSDRFRSWFGRLTEDVDLGTDARMMVPVFYDLAREKTKVWVFMGWSVRPLMVSFAKDPRVEVLDSKGQVLPPDGVELRLRASRYEVVYPVMAEVYVTDLMNRSEFRAHCDRYKTEAAILENLR